MKKLDLRIIKYVAIAQIVFGLAVIGHNVLLINIIGRAETLQIAGLLDGAVIIILALFYLMSIRHN